MPVTAGQPLLTLHADDSARFARALESLTDAIETTPADGTQYRPGPLVIDRITA